MRTKLQQITAQKNDSRAYSVSILIFRLGFLFLFLRIYRIGKLLSIKFSIQCLPHYRGGALWRAFKFFVFNVFIFHLTYRQFFLGNILYYYLLIIN